MKILIIGGTQFIGKAVAAQAAERGHEVILFNRGKTQPNSPYPAITGDVDQLIEHKTVLRNVGADIVIHAIAYTERHAKDVVDVFAGTGCRLVTLSSQDCYEAFFQLNRGRDVADLPMAEDAPTCHKSYYWQDLPGIKKYPEYDKNLVTAEILSAHQNDKIRATVLRLPMVFGPGDSQYMGRHGRFIRRIYDRQPMLVMGAIQQCSLFTFGFIDNIAAAIVCAAESPVVDGNIYNIGETKSRSLRRWAELYGAAAGTQFEFSVLPDPLVEMDLGALQTGPRLLLFDSGEFRRTTGFSEPIDVSEQVKRTLAWGLEHPEVLGSKPDYVSEQSLVRSYHGFLKDTVAP